MTRIAAASAALALSLFALPAGAAEFLIGLGADDVLDQEGATAGAALLEIRSGVLTELGSVEVKVLGALEADADADVWAGAGVALHLPLTDSVRLEASFAPGLYSDNDGQDLGGPIEFRTQIGISVAISDGLRLGAAFNHKSNAGIYDENPGTEAAYLTLGYEF